MEKIQLKFAELRSPLFLKGKNFQLKLDPGALPGLELFYNKPDKELLVHWEGETGIVPMGNVAVMVPGIPKPPFVQSSHPIVAGLAQTAQVQTPYSHVHAGLGAGKTK